MRIKLGILILLVWSLVVSCGGETPRSVVEQALEYRIAHPIGPRQEVLGLESLQDQIDLTGVKITEDRPLTLPGGQGQSLAARHLEGTYRLRVDPKGERRYFRRREPFQLTLAEREEEQTWVLVKPISGSGSHGSETIWTTQEFMPRPVAEPADTGSGLPEQISGGYQDPAQQEIPLGSPGQRFSAPNS